MWLVEQQSVVVHQMQGGDPVEEPVVLPDAAHINEGKTLAGWTLTYVCAAGALLVALGMILSLMALIIAGVAVVVVGLVLGAVLRAMGHGQPRITKDGDLVA